MIESLSEFIARRRQEITAAEEALKEQLHALLEERLRLARAESAIAGTSNQDQCIVRQAKERRQPRGIIKRAILKTLEDAPEGMDALTILFTINYRLGSNFARTSLSPQLSRRIQHLRSRTVSERRARARPGLCITADLPVHPCVLANLRSLDTKRYVPLSVL